MANPLPEQWITIDPGDKHVGMAVWQRENCVSTHELSPDQALRTLDYMTSPDFWKPPSLVVYERFALDPRRAGQQSGSEFGTSQMIGVIKWLCQKAKVECVGYTNSQHKRVYSMDWYKGLSLKDKRSLPWWGVGANHAKDAWCLGMWHRHVNGYVGLGAGE